KAVEPAQATAPAAAPAAVPPAAAPADPNALAAPAAAAPAGTVPAATAAADPTAAAAPAASTPSADAVAPAAAGFTSSADLTYPGDNASQAQIAAWMGNLAQQRGLPRELPVMASLVESGMKNINYGDRDSVGFYQMRTGIWNQGAYAGFPDKPELQVKWFLDQAEAVKQQRLAAGQSVTDPHQYGDWIADIERPAEQYRGRYQLQLDQA